jgi:ribonuclease P protein component
MNACLSKGCAVEEGAGLNFTSMAKQFGLGKKERLKSRKQIETLFAQGKSFSVFPVRVTYSFVPADEEPPAQIGVTVSKRYFKKAVDRNRIKRLLREAYRLQKTELAEALRQSGKKGYLFFMYTDKDIASFDIIKTAMNHCLKRLKQKLGSINENSA